MKAVKVGNIGTDHDGFHPTKVTAGSPDVFIDGVPAARVGDPLEPHDKPNHPKHGRTIATGSSTVFINGKPAGITGGAISCGGVTIGDGTVNIGDQPPASSSTAPASAELNSNEEAVTESTPETLQKMVKKIVNATAGTGIFTPMEVLVPASENEIANSISENSNENKIEEQLANPLENQPQPKEEHDIQLAFKDSQGNPVPDYEFKATLGDGTIVEGKTNTEGLSKVIAEAENSQPIKIEKKSSWLLRDDNE